MRGFTLRAVPVCVVAFAAGCFFTNSSVTPDNGKSAPTVTHTYWQGVSAALAQRPAGNDLKAMLQTVRAQTDALRGLSPDGVDETLVAAVNDVIRAEDEVLHVADMVGEDLGALRTSKEMAVAFQTANRKAADAKKRVRGLRDALNTRYGGGFAVLGG
ncbi:MAG: hypothetical protein J0I06_17390 [Planctomycetes bacterium]|nr:hypothetical protein [Planctomycetota bacterium]